MIRFLLPVLAVLSLAGCGRSEVNPPTEPAEPIQAGETRVVHAPGTGPASFVGRWAARVEWCARPNGAERPVEITPVRFEGYENSCHIATIDQTATGYDATLQCAAEGGVRAERVHFEADGQQLKLTWRDRGQTVKLLKCTTLEDVPTGPASLTVPQG